MMNKRKAVENEQQHITDERVVSWDQVMEEAAALGGALRARTRYVGVRQRPSGRWVAEIKDTIQKIRVWLGTYDTAEQAARAYDEAACLLRGANTRTNFWPSNSHSKPALPSKITNLLLERLKARNSITLNDTNNNHNSSTSSSSSSSYSLASHDQEKITQFDNLFDFPAENSNLFENSCNDHNGHLESNGTYDSDQNWSLISFDNDHEHKNTNEYYSPFEVAEEMMMEHDYECNYYGGEEDDEEGNSIMKRMKYERKLSASLYAYNGVSECLRVKRRSISNKVNTGSCDNYNLNSGDENNNQKINGCEVGVMPSSSTSKENGDEVIWSSIDLPPICFINV